MRWLYMLLAAGLLTSCGGGGDSESVIRLTRAGQSVVFQGENRTGPITLKFGLQFVDYFRCVPNGHAGVMLRADLERIPTADYRGVGLAFGRFGNDSYTTRELPHLEPLAVLETWGNPPDAILAQSVHTGLKDGPVYPVTVTSRKTEAGNVIRYTLGDFDSGDVLDVNPNVAMEATNVAFYDASGPALCPYEIRIIDLKEQS
jgi:hypothetical protein